MQALIAAADGTLYAATSPDGKVYRIEHKPEDKTAKKPGTKKEEKKEEAPAPAEQADNAKVPVDPNFTSSVLFDPKTKYIWALALDKEGRLYVATGDRGEIFRVTRTGEGSVFFKSDEAHIRALDFDAKGNLIAGTDGSGLIYRITPAGEGFVLYSAPKKEITALAIDEQGNIYASGIGEKTQRPAFPMPLPQAAPLPQQSIGLGPGLGVTAITQAIPVGPIPQMGVGNSPGTSEVYCIAPDGSPRRIWAPQDIVYALDFDQHGRLLVGTGNRGHIFAVTPDGEATDLVKASANQVTAFAKGPNGSLYAATSNLGKVFTIAATPEPEGTYESDVFDAKIFSQWGRAEVRSTGNVELFARSGNVDNPDRNWSPWRKVDVQHTAALDVPPARFVQWRAVLHPGTTPATIDSVALNYRAKNVAPVIDEVFVQPGARFNPMPRPTVDNSPVTVGPAPPPGPRFEVPTPAVKDKDSIAVRWTAHDDNEDQLLFAVYYRGDNEREWKLLKDKLSDRFYSWDAGLLPDGGYSLRVVASDAPSHSPDEALAAQKDSSRFEVDHTPPAVDALTAKIENGVMHVTFRASDGFSPIKRAEYSVDAGEWQFVEPVGQLSDAKIENYDFNAPLTKPPAAPGSNEPATRGGDGKSSAPATTGEHVVVVRVWDRYDNMGTGKTVLAPK